MYEFIQEIYIMRTEITYFLMNKLFSYLNNYNMCSVISIDAYEVASWLGHEFNKKN